MVNSKKAIASKTIIFNAICILAPVVGIHAAWITPANLATIATALDIAQDQLPIVGAQLICAGNIALRFFTSKPIKRR